MKRFLFAAGVLFSVFAALCVLLYFGVIHLNNPSRETYPVAGVDVSHYQGKIDWETLSAQNISFAFIKATEGSSTVDPCFEENFENASKTGLRIGAYHFFSFESSGEKQAKLYLNTVKAVDNMLPPVIDVEFYGGFRSQKDIDVSAIKNELRALIDLLTAEYGMKPIIYCDETMYGLIVSDGFADCDLWYRSVYSSVPDGICWTFWQYSNRHVLEGYAGDERYIDMNVFSGSADDFAAYPG